MKLVIGNKNYSSWSLRVWLAMAETGIPFDEVLIPLDQPDTKARIAEYSPSGRVPTLVDGDIAVWETLAILEYLAERFPEKQLWPADSKARAVARAIASEMHSGFVALRSAAPMNLWRPVEAFPLTPEVEADVKRITTLWRDARQRFGAGGPFLFGRFSNADAMYAPIATRLRTYAIPVDDVSAAYVETIHAMASFRRWRDAGLKETWLIAGDERDWPTVKRV
jgi:glutathione S-transferase